MSLDRILDATQCARNSHASCEDRLARIGASTTPEELVVEASLAVAWAERLVEELRLARDLAGQMVAAKRGESTNVVEFARICR